MKINCIRVSLQFYHLGFGKQSKTKKVNFPLITLSPFFTSQEPAWF